MLFFDIETDGLLDTVTKVHCMVIINTEGEVTRYRPNEVLEGAKRLQKAVEKGEAIVGHNIIDFDIPCLEKLFTNDFKIAREYREHIIDTLVLSRLIYGDISDKDMGLVRTDRLPGKLVGSHSLKAWGYRLGELKGTYAEETEDAWIVFNEEMLAYNEQDVKVTKKLFDTLSQKREYPAQSIWLEHQAQWLISQMKRNGFSFDTEKAQHLEMVLRGRHAVLDSHLRRVVPPIPDKIFVPKRDNKKLGYIKGVPIQRYKDFNPNSRQQIEWLLLKHFDYHPDEEDLYEGDRLKIDDDTFRYIKKDETAPKEIQEIASIMEEYLMISKRLGQLADGKFGWLKMVSSDGRIHGNVNPCGAVTGRATHASPNIAQVPSISSPYGKECRELFHAPNGWYQAGVDASGLELRCLAHYMARYDGGAYAHEILNGDIHTANQKAAGLPERNMAKTFIYGFLYGAGDEKIGKIVHGDAKDGKKLKKKFLEHTPAIANLRDAIKNSLVEKEQYGKVLKWKRKFLKGLDGRPLKVRSLHAALNLLLQSAGALICKYWIIRLEERLLKLGLEHGEDFQYMAWIHDEVQIACRTHEIAECVVKEAQEAMRDTQAYFNFRVQLDTEGKIGLNWGDCH